MATFKKHNHKHPGRKTCWRSSTWVSFGTMTLNDSSKVTFYMAYFNGSPTNSWAYSLKKVPEEKVTSVSTWARELCETLTKTNAGL